MTEEQSHGEITGAHYQDIMKSKRLQENIHLLMRLVEPKIVPNSNPESLNIFENEQSCIKPAFIYHFNSAMTQAAA